MERGTHSTIENLAQKLLRRWVPKWYEAFCDNARGGFHERLGKGFRPVPVGYRRLLTQCRQLALYSDAEAGGQAPSSFRPDLARHFEFILAHYYVDETGGWRFSVNEDGAPLEKFYDLYALSFVIFAMAHYYRATHDERARDYAHRTLDFIDARMRVGGLPGFVEALSEHLAPMPLMRRHESHMHLLEACLFAAQVWNDSDFAAMADEIVELFFSHFYDAGNVTLREYYTDTLAPHPAKGHIVEPGHYCEWIWLLKKHDPDAYGDTCAALLTWANEHGWDREYGGIFDELKPDGAIVLDTKRIWPFTEALKANALMLDSGMDKNALKSRIAEMIKIFRTKYMQERGFWTEWLKRDLSPAVDYMPGTTPYHVYFGIMETREVMQSRGAPVSLRMGAERFFYGFRRALSDRVRDVRFKLKKTG